MNRIGTDEKHLVIGAFFRLGYSFFLCTLSESDDYKV